VIVYLIGDPKEDIQGGIDIWGDLEEWEGKYGIEYSNEDKEDIQKRKYPIVKFGKDFFPSIVEYTSLQNEIFCKLYQELETRKQSYWNYCKLL